MSQVPINEVSGKSLFGGIAQSIVLGGLEGAWQGVKTGNPLKVVTHGLKGTGKGLAGHLDPDSDEYKERQKKKEQKQQQQSDKDDVNEAKFSWQQLTGEKKSKRGNPVQLSPRLSKHPMTYPDGTVKGKCHVNESDFSEAVFDQFVFDRELTLYGRRIKKIAGHHTMSNSRLCCSTEGTKT
jgi:hypothetical protein